jgi:hypothetical protein
MTPPPDAVADSPVESADASVDPTGVAATGLLSMVGVSGAVCVDGICSFDPVVQPLQEGDHARS